MHVEVIDLSGNARQFDVPATDLVSQLLARLNLDACLKGQLSFQGHILDPQRTLRDASVQDGSSLNLIILPDTDRASLCGVWKKHMDLMPGNPYESHVKNYVYKLFPCGHAFYSYRSIYREYPPSDICDVSEESGWGKWSFDGGHISIETSDEKSKSQHRNQLKAKDLIADWKQDAIKSVDSADLQRYLTSLQEAARAMHVEVLDLSGNTRKFDLQPEDRISQLMARLNLSKNKMVQLMFQGNILDPQRTLQESVPAGATLNLKLMPSLEAVAGVWTKTINHNSERDSRHAVFTYKLFSNGHAFYEYSDTEERRGPHWSIPDTYTDKQGAGWGTWSYDNGSILISCSMSNTTCEDRGDKRQSDSKHNEQTSAKELSVHWTQRDISADDFAKLNDFQSTSL